MKTAGIARLKAKLSEYLDIVKAGEDVLITEHGRPIARITSTGGKLDEDARRARLIREGVLRPGKGPVSMELIRNLQRTNIPRETILRIIEEEREDRA